MVPARGHGRVGMREQLLGELTLIARLLALERQVVGIEGPVDGGDGHERGSCVRGRAVQLRQCELSAFVVHSASSVVVRVERQSHDSGAPPRWHYLIR